CELQISWRYLMRYKTIWRPSRAENRGGVPRKQGAGSGTKRMRIDLPGWTNILKRFILARFLGAARPRPRSACENPPFFLSSLLFSLCSPRVRSGFQISADQPADSRAGLLEHKRFAGRQLQTLHRRGTSTMVEGHYALAQRAPHSNRL